MKEQKNNENINDFWGSSLGKLCNCKRCEERKQFEFSPTAPIGGERCLADRLIILIEGIISIEEKFNNLIEEVESVTGKPVTIIGTERGLRTIEGVVNGRFRNAPVIVIAPVIIPDYVFYVMAADTHFRY